MTACGSPPIVRSIASDLCPATTGGPVPPIHIIVKNGILTLTGVVLNDGDRNLANIRANGVSGVFSVTNDLRIETQS